MIYMVGEAHSHIWGIPTNYLLLYRRIYYYDRVTKDAHGAKTFSKKKKGFVLYYIETPCHKLCYPESEGEVAPLSGENVHKDHQKLAVILLPQSTYGKLSQYVRMLHKQTRPDRIPVG